MSAISGTLLNLAQAGDEIAALAPRETALEDEIKAAAAQHKKIVVVEMNDGQYRGEMERILRRDVISMPMLGGKISLKEIKERLHEL